MWRALRVLGVDRADWSQVNAAAERSYLVTSFQHSQETEAYENTPRSASIATSYLPSKVVCIYETCAGDDRVHKNPEEAKMRHQLIFKQ
jgi:hypothetical protein